MQRLSNYCWRFQWRLRSYWYRRHLDTPLILLYHRVVTHRSDPLLLDVSPELFEEQMSFLKKHYDLLPLEDFTTSWLSGRLPKRAVAITFDDGYVDNLQHAAPILSSLEIPATIFVMTGLLGSNREAWWDALEHIFLNSKDLPSELSLNLKRTTKVLTLPREIDADNDHWTIESPARSCLQRAYLELISIMMDSTFAEQNELLAQLYQWAKLPMVARAERRFMSEDELRVCASTRGISIGAHTDTHERLSLLPYEQQLQTIIHSKHRLESILERPVPLFSYPFGTYREYGLPSISAIKSAGFRYSYANMPDRCHRLGSRFELPRVLVRNWGLEEFQTRLGLHPR